MASHSDAPDLNSVLQALSSLAPQGSSSQLHETNLPQHHVTHPPRIAATHTHRPAYPDSPKPGTPTIDPSTITTWDEAKRYLRETVRIQEEAAAAQAKEYGNEKEQKKESPLILRIRRLIKEQHDYERRWWEGRQALLQRQKTRGAKKKELDAVLLSIGAPVDSKALSTAEEDQAELKNYDMKIYQKSVKMAEDLKAELRALRIPFFVLKDSLVQDSSPANLDGASDRGSKLSKTELMNLQRRMLELLEVRCED